MINEVFRAFDNSLVTLLSQEFLLFHGHSSRFISEKSGHTDMLKHNNVV